MDMTAFIDAWKTKQEITVEELAALPEDEVEQMMRIVKEGMQNVVKLKVPLVANASIGRTWYEAK